MCKHTGLFDMVLAELASNFAHFSEVHITCMIDVQLSKMAVPY